MCQNNNRTLEKRRGFLRAALRSGIALGAVAGGAALSRRNGTLGENACLDPQGQIGCNRCALLAACRRPRGLSFKQVRGDGDNG